MLIKQLGPLSLIVSANPPTRLGFEMNFRRYAHDIRVSLGPFTAQLMWLSRGGTKKASQNNLR